MSVGIFQIYGMTETSFCLIHPQKRGNATSVGQILPGNKVKVVSIETGHVVRTANEEGELLVKGPAVMQGYLGRDDAFTDDGWIKTGKKKSLMA